MSLTIPAGKLVALVGLSGSGKSTLVALVQRLYDPGAGAVLLDGRDLRELDAGWFRSQIGVVSQVRCHEIGCFFGGAVAAGGVLRGLAGAPSLWEFFR